MLLLIQFRTDRSGPHEISCVHQASELPFQDIVTVNAHSRAETDEAILHRAKQATAVLLGGCGESGFEASNTNQKQFRDAYEKVAPTLSWILSEDIPTLGLCFGHQLLADFTDGVVAQRDSLAETGIAELSLTDEGKKDPLFSGLPNPFRAVVGHKTSVVTKPDDAVNLAESSNCQYQAFRYQNNIYTCQFHPELNIDGLTERLKLYPEYLENELQYDRTKPVDADQIAARFFSTYIHTR